MENLDALNRKQIQTLAKEHGIKANQTTKSLRNQLNEIYAREEGKEDSQQSQKGCRQERDVCWFFSNETKFAIGLELYKGGLPIINEDTSRTFIKVYVRGMPGQGDDIICQLFYLSSGRNSKLKGMWIPTNILTLRLSPGKNKQWHWYYQKKPWYIGGPKGEGGDDPATRFGGDPVVGLISLILGGIGEESELAIEKLKKYIDTDLASYLHEKFGDKGSDEYVNLILYQNNMSSLIQDYILKYWSAPRSQCDHYDIDMWIGPCNSYNWFAPFVPDLKYIPNLNPADKNSMWKELPKGENEGKLFLSSGWLDMPKLIMEERQLNSDIKKLATEINDKTLTKEEREEKTTNKSRKVGRLMVVKNILMYGTQGGSVSFPQDLLSRSELDADDEDDDL